VIGTDPLKSAKHLLKWFYLSKTAQKWKGRHTRDNCRVFWQLNRFHAWEISNKEFMYISFVKLPKQPSAEWKVWKEHA